MSHLTDGPIDTADLVRHTVRASDGASIVFEGVVRNHHDGKAVQHVV
ncbi:MAG: molybdenum cofactor biosynthesis protein MoaE, partial [Thermoanaerobaculia bacterium]